MSDRRDTTETTVASTSTGEDPVRGRQPVGGDDSEPFTPPASAGAEMRDDHTHTSGSLEGPNTGDTGGAAGISIGILWTAVILLVVAASVILFFAL